MRSATSSNRKIPKDRAIAYLFVVAICTTGWTGNRYHKVSYSGTMPLRSSTVAYKNMCVTFDGYVKAGKFFDGLVSEEVNGKVRFRKGSEEPTVFPEEMEIDIDVRGAQCTAAAYDVPTATAPFLDLVSFEAHWTDAIGNPSAALTLLSNEQRPWNELTPSRAFRLRLISKNVPLTGQLTVLVRYDNKTIANLSGAVSVTVLRGLMSRPQVVYRLAY
jgi:hypothetical protein